MELSVQQKSPTAAIHNVVRNADVKPSLVMAEKELLQNVRLCETLQELDTLTVTTDLVRDCSAFYQICREISSSNFLKLPYSIKRQNGTFITEPPQYFNPRALCTLAQWIVFFLERCMYISYYAHCRQKFKPCNPEINEFESDNYLEAKDNKKSIFI